MVLKKRLGVCFRWSTSVELNHNMKEDGDGKFSDGEYFGLEEFRTFVALCL